MEPPKKIIKISEKYPKKKKALTHKLTFHQLDWLEWITIILGLWFLFYPKPYKLLLGILLVIPIVGILLNGINKPSIASLFEIDDREDGKYDVADFLDVAALMVFIRVTIDFKYESFYSLIIPGTITFITVVLLLFATHKKIEESNQQRTWIYFAVIGSIFVYSYAGTYAVNCAYDTSVPERYEAMVLDKKEIDTRKRRRRYSITIAPWGENRETEKMYVTESLFNSVEVGKRTVVNRKRGVFGIPWYYVRK